MCVQLWKRRLILSGIILATACVSRRIDLPPFIAPTRDATCPELVEIVNGRQGAQTFIVRAELQFETREAAEEGAGRRYRSGQGRILLARPEHILLTIEAPLLAANVADMASDGKRFQLLIYPEEYRALIEGSNPKNYVKEARKLDNDPELKKAGPLVNIRPQHFTEAFLFDPIDLDDPKTIVICEENRLLEVDDRPRARKEQKVIRSYYVMSLIQRGEQAPGRKYWFDRSRDLSLSRQQIFDPSGLLIGDVKYSKYLPPEAVTGIRFPSEIHIDRPYEEYSLRITLKPDSLQVNREIPPTAFALEPPPEWGESIRRVDLDRKDKRE